MWPLIRINHMPNPVAWHITPPAAHMDLTPLVE